MTTSTRFAQSVEFDQADEQFMQQALALAEQGLFSTDPNPRVGCVLVKHGQIIGSGAHRRAGEAHAEVHALHQAGSQARGAHAYVTLEPCCHQGRTGPCAGALIEAGISAVTYALDDADPKVAGAVPACCATPVLKCAAACSRVRLSI
jgi:diaminohydroxyphosphoribosylaminopyrimidine deaminase/5-amino-6-(5-phosphoribosylamino)uracil reductase